MLKSLVCVSLFLGISTLPAGAQDGAPYENWTSGVNKHPVASLENRHVIHSYYTNPPESPDGRYVLYYTSGAVSGEEGGDLRILERSTGKETIIAQNIIVEDCHRAACQQWANNGKTVVYHDCRQGRWFVIAIDLATLKEKILADDRQLGFCSPHNIEVPVVGCHWNPGKYRDLELVNVETGAIRTVVTADAMMEKYGEWLRKRFGDVPLSICFPDLSPDGKMIYFKIARRNGYDTYRGGGVSFRDGKIVYDLEKNEFVRLYPQWGHPSWHPNSRQIFERGNILFDPFGDKAVRYVPGSPTDHPSISPNGELFVTDGQESEKEKEWVIVVGNPAGKEYTIVDKFDNSQGAKTWRHSHPHPAFSADGQRIYYNVNDGPWTRLFVAEAAQSSAKP